MDELHAQRPRWGCAVTTVTLAAVVSTVVALIGNPAHAYPEQPPEQLSQAASTARSGNPMLRRPADGAYTNKPRPVFAGTARLGLVPIVVHVDRQIVCTATADHTGTWKCTPTTDVPDGTHTVTVTYQSPHPWWPFRAPSTPSTTITVDTRAPAPPTIHHPGWAQWLDTPTPHFSGRSEPYATITVTDHEEGHLLTTHADAKGHWSQKLFGR